MRAKGRDTKLGNPGAISDPDTDSIATDIPRNEWISFFDSFSRQHMDWLVTIKSDGPTGRFTLEEEIRLMGISTDHVDGRERVYIEIGETPENHVTHTIEAPIRITFRQTQSGAHQGLVIASSDESAISLSFRAPIRPEMLDGVAA